MNRLYSTKAELRKALKKDLADREKMKKHGRGTKMITKAIQNKKRILNSKSYWK